jgi:hypothetical protein
MYNNQVSTIELANAYARFYMEDHAANVMRHLGGSHPVPQEQLAAFVSDKVDAMVAETPIVISNNNTLCRYLYECAEHALEQGIEEPGERQVWDQIKDLPSIHHSELNALAFVSADHYAKTTDKMLLGVLARDAVTTSEAILQAAQTRISQTETGGDLHKFSWGLLNDGLWLNGALAKAFSLARIFRPGENPQAHYAVEAFQSARKHARLGDLNHDAQALACGEVDTLISQIDPNEINALMENCSQAKINSVLFTLGELGVRLDHWEYAARDVKQLVPAIEEMSGLAQMLGTLIEAARVMEDSSLVSEATKDRLNKAYDSVTMSLMAFHALRETKFAQALILDVQAQGNDPKVDVLINNDLLNSYKAAGGDEDDLIRFGMHLDPRNGTPASNIGHSMSYVLARRDKVVPMMMAQDADRLEKLRNNDAAVIQEQTIGIVGAVVGSYVQATGQNEVSKSTVNQIHRLARDLTQGNTELKLDEAITNILVNSANDPSLVQMSQSMSQHLNSSNEFQKTHAPALTIAEAALHDAMLYVTTDAIAE